MKPPVAIVSGLLLSVALAVVGTWLAAARWLSPRVDWVAHMPGPTYLAATLGVAFGSSVLGGFLAAHLTRAHRFRCGAGVAVGLALLEALSFAYPATGQPPFFLWLLPTLAAVGALAGGSVRAMARTP